MATELQIFDHTFKAGADLTGMQFRICKLGTNAREVVLAGLSDAGAFGVLQDDPAAVGRAVAVRMIGISKVVAGAAVAIHSPVGPDASGRAIVAAAGAAIGINLEAAGAAGDIITVLMIGPTKIA